jgi:hypothetical protein
VFALAWQPPTPSRPGQLSHPSPPLHPPTHPPTIPQACAGIYPLQNVAVRKVKVLKAPKFDLTKLMEVWGVGGGPAAAEGLRATPTQTLGAARRGLGASSPTPRA